ncbi:RagB/SusD family nutrient uptake outer membrane protein [Parabacteroides sp. FAFU027]|uniref:RagB/SusD family nutrient uptake outer membrane protein n=1 Tax=Parabacteroides sp. FAFU027 TaxID=2922715 RepID=UPI001FAFAE6D|nr:RagB/SusD family nutrient uptake outer membrane protein [Parabacteroides sp. FAFU027]
MRNKIYIYCLLLLTLIATPGCSDWLDLKPTDGVPRQDYWKTKEDVSSFMTGIYSSMLNTDLVSKMFLWGEMRADMITSSPRVSLINLDQIMDGEISAANPLCKWSSFYKTINQCNTLLKFAPDAQVNDESFTPQMLKEYEAQAVVIRSLMYFYLVRTFGDVPFIRDAYVDNSKTMSVAKNTQEEIIPELIKDLNAVMDNVPYKYSNTNQALNKGKVTRWMAESLLADIYLWNEQYAECNALCDEVINSGQFSLYPVGREEVVIEGTTPELNDTIYIASENDASAMFQSVYVNGNSSESIFELQFNDQAYNPFYAMMSQAVGYVAAKTDVLSEMIYTPSQINHNFSDIRESMAQSKGYIWKYMGKARINGTERIQSEMTNHYILYRLPEIYLMKAEALTQIGINTNDQDKLKEAYDALKIVRDRANATDGTDLLAGASSIDGATLERFVMNEKARELAYEGKRWFDVLRNAKRNSYKHLDYLTELAQYSAPSEKVVTLQTKYKNKLSHYLPIYSGELETNPKLVQNAFYDDGKSSK